MTLRLGMFSSTSLKTASKTTSLMTITRLTSRRLPLSRSPPFRGAVLTGKPISSSLANHFCCSPAPVLPPRSPCLLARRWFSVTPQARREIHDTPCGDGLGLGREIQSDYAHMRQHYAAPKHPVVLAHGLLGFAELKLPGDFFPAVHYWHGIREALVAAGVKVHVASVPPSHCIADRAAKLALDIEAMCPGENVNIIAHSMGGLDARYMISRIKSRGVCVKSLVTVATPHHGSTFSDYLLETIGAEKLPGVYQAVERMGLGTGAFEQLTRKYMVGEFNRETPDEEGVRYFSFGAVIDRPPLLSPFRVSHRVIEEREGPNDGLVSVASSRWGSYKGTLMGVSHLDLINWSNRVRGTVRRWMGHDPSFNAIAFYLDIADMLEKEGL